MTTPTPVRLTKDTYADRMWTGTLLSLGLMRVLEALYYATEPMERRLRDSAGIAALKESGT